MMPIQKLFSVWNGITIGQQYTNLQDIKNAVHVLNPFPRRTTWREEWLVKAGEGGTWQAALGDNHQLALSGPSKLADLVQEGLTLRGKLNVIPYVVIRGRPEWDDAEHQQIVDCCQVAQRCILNLEPGAQYWDGPIDQQQLFNEYINPLLDRLNISLGANNWQLEVCMIPRQWTQDVLGGEPAWAAWVSKVQRVSYECLVPETKVLKADFTWESLGNIRQGDMLITFDGELNRYGNGTTYKTGVVYNIGRKVEECYKVVTTSGTFICTAHHLWVVSSGRYGRTWETTYNLMKTVPQYKRTLTKICNMWYNDNSYDTGYIAGILDGEGSVGIGPGLKINYSQLPGAVLNNSQRILDNMGYKFYNNIDKRTGVVRPTISGIIKVMELLGRTGPKRLIPKAVAILDGLKLQALEHPLIESIEAAGKREVVTIETSSGTLIAEGFLTHNCYDATAADLDVAESLARVKQWAADTGWGGKPQDLIPVVQRSRIGAWANTKYCKNGFEVWFLDGD